MQSSAYILLGSNLGNRMKMLDDAEILINKYAGKVIHTSNTYETAAWGKTDQSSFLNKVIHLSTSHAPESLLKILLGIEQKMGRERIEKWGPRTIDADILYYDSIIINESKLVIPHPEIQSRRFTLIPLCEIAFNYMHPVFKISNSELLKQCRDESEVTLYNLR